MNYNSSTGFVLKARAPAPAAPAPAAPAAPAPARKFKLSRLVQAVAGR